MYIQEKPCRPPAAALNAVLTPEKTRAMSGLEQMLAVKDGLPRRWRGR
jgi:hypothetical protein